MDVIELLIPSKVNMLPQDLFEKNKFATALLMPSLLHFYVDCERTGGSNQSDFLLFSLPFSCWCRYYEKFGIRYHIGNLMEYLWFRNVQFKQSLTKELQNKELFLRFATLLTNDATDLLDEALRKLEEIHDLETLRDSEQWATLSNAQKQEKQVISFSSLIVLTVSVQEHLQQLLRSTRSYNLLSQTSLKTFRYLSRDLVDPFLSPELIDRLGNERKREEEVGLIFSQPACSTIFWCFWRVPNAAN